MCLLSCPLVLLELYVLVSFLFVFMPENVYVCVCYLLRCNKEVKKPHYMRLRENTSKDKYGRKLAALC